MDPAAIRDDAATLAYALRARFSPAGTPVRNHIPEVDADACVYCLTCVRVCPFKAMTTDPEERVAKVVESACQACGICAAECPAEAIQIRNLDNESVTSALKALV
jgi:heterodisulfide reductase subunit A